MGVINFDKAREDAAATREPGDDTDEERRPLWRCAEPAPVGLVREVMGRLERWA